MEKVITVLFLFIGVVTYAQTPVEQIINAEHEFEKDCRELGIKGGFLANLDSNAVAFTQSGIENAKSYWESLPDVPGIYSWKPSFAEVSKGGDWGYTTGAVEYRDTSINDAPSSYNQYTTVWHKTETGEWKYLVDIGNTHGPVEIDKTAKEIRVEKMPVKNLSKQTILNLENSYSKQLSDVGISVFKKFTGKSYILNITGYAAITSVDTASNILREHIPYIQYLPYKVETSPKGDMAVVYGRMKYKGASKFYVRIWRRETTGWKIALEVTKI